MPYQHNDQKLLVWGSDIEVGTLQQAERTSRLPFIDGHVALMPDAHVGMGATVGSVIPTKGAIIPAAIGVDIGCGMMALETDLHAERLPDSYEKLLGEIGRVIPAGVGRGFTGVISGQSQQWMLAHKRSDFSQKEESIALTQLGTLGSGNHFFEICLDTNDYVWLVLHSGSRGIGNKLAQKHIKNAKNFAKKHFIKLEDPDLAYLVEGDESFDNYIKDMLWSQDYAMENRRIMMRNAWQEFFLFMQDCGLEVEVKRTINCHHNFTQKEHHGKSDLWITRKGAIKADKDDWGIIPGSMGTATYIIQGKGNPASYNSCSHGAGRRMSRSRAKEEFSIEDLEKMMAHVPAWNSDKAKYLVDEIPASYKDISTVMDDQQDLVEVKTVLRQILNYKGC